MLRTLWFSFPINLLEYVRHLMASQLNICGIWEKRQRMPTKLRICKSVITSTKRQQHSKTATAWEKAQLRRQKFNATVKNANTLFKNASTLSKKANTLSKNATTWARCARTSYYKNGAPGALHSERGEAQYLLMSMAHLMSDIETSSNKQST